MVAASGEERVMRVPHHAIGSAQRFSGGSVTIPIPTQVRSPGRQKSPCGECRKTREYRSPTQAIPILRTRKYRSPTQENLLAPPPAGSRAVPAVYPADAERPANTRICCRDQRECALQGVDSGEYRSLTQAIPILRARDYRSATQVLPIRDASFTDPPRKQYRSLAQASRVNSLQNGEFACAVLVSLYVIWMLMLCMC